MMALTYFSSYVKHFVRHTRRFSTSCGYFSELAASHNIVDYNEKVTYKVSKSCPTIEAHSIWLRHHCRCPLCFNNQTHQRVKIPSDLPMLSKILSYNYETGKLNVTWCDGHESQYDQLWLSKYIPKRVDKNRRLMYNEEHCSFEDEPELVIENTVNPLETAIPFTQFMREDNDGVQILLSNIIKHGFGIVNDCPPDFETTKAVIRKVSHPQNTIFGDFSEWTSNLAHADTAYTTDFVHLHTDTTYFTEPIGLQIFHCLKHEGTGGMNFLADGWKLAKLTHKNNPDMYKQLSRVQVPCQYIDTGKHYFHSNDYIFGHDRLYGQLTKIRYNPHDMAVLHSLRFEDVPEFYKSLVYFSNILESNPMPLKLTPGLVIFLDNWRTLHGRSAFTGFRHLCGAYISRSDWLSRARTLGIMPI